MGRNAVPIHTNQILFKSTTSEQTLAAAARGCSLSLWHGRCFAYLQHLNPSPCLLALGVAAPAEADEPAPELDENGEPVVPPPEPPVESLQTPQFMEALTDLVYHAAAHRLDQFEDVAAARGWEAAYELDRRAAVAAEEKMAWTRFEILRQRFQLLQGASRPEYTA